MKIELNNAYAKVIDDTITEEAKTAEDYCPVNAISINND